MHPKTPTRTTWIVAAMIGLMSAASWAQPMSVSTPAKSPLWWTLSPEFKPRQLRAAYRAPFASIERYEEAVEAGLEPARTTDELTSLVFYENPTLHPEVTPMWLALNILATMTEVRLGPDLVGRELRDFGVSQGGSKRIVAALEAIAVEEARLIAEVGPKQLEIQRIAIAAEQRGLPAGAVDRAFAEGDSGFFSRAGSGLRTEVLDDLFASIERNPPAEATSPALVELKRELRRRDWRNLRRYLLEVVVPRTGPSIAFETEGS